MVEQYNQLVAKHNALIEKTRNLISSQSQQQDSLQTVDPLIQQKLNEALARAAALEKQLTNLQQDKMRSSNSNKYLDDTNTRLRRQLQEMKADEQVLAQQNKELSAETESFLPKINHAKMTKKITTIKFEILNSVEVLYNEEQTTCWSIISLWLLKIKSSPLITTDLKMSFLL